MGDIGNRPHRANEFAAVKRPPELDQYVGRWVAIKDGQVVASAASSVELVDEVRALGEDGEDAVAEFVSPPSDSWMVGVG